jgi:hypothetical protein
MMISKLKKKIDLIYKLLNHLNFAQKVLVRKQEALEQEAIT